MLVDWVSKKPWILAVLSAGLLPAAALGESPNPPPFYAVEGARLVTGTGDVVEGGTIVVAEGLISAVGTDAEIPPEAWVIDGAGLTVYPGLIDALTDLGLGGGEGPGGRGGPPGAGRPPGRGAPRGGASQSPPYSAGPEDRPGTSSWKRAADELKTTDKRLEKWRNAGFTAAVTAPTEGIFPGQAAFINLAGERPRDMVLKTPVALPVKLEEPGGYRGFPGALMGRIAYVRQLFLDAEHYRESWAAYEASPRGMARPRWDRTLEPLVAARGEGWPVLLPAAWSKEIVRAVRLGEELGVRTVVRGAHQGYAAVDALRGKEVAVLVSVDWPSPPEDADPDADRPLRELEMRDRAPSTPAALHDAGVPFAFTSDGLEDPGDILTNVRAAIAAGLSEDAALRALTLGSAEIYGLDDRLGSLEVGKIANLTVTDGDLFAEETKVKMVFVDGRKIEIREKEKPERGEGDEEAPAESDRKRGKKKKGKKKPSGEEVGR